MLMVSALPLIDALAVMRGQLWPEPVDLARHISEQPSGIGELRYLERDVATVTDDFATNLPVVAVYGLVE
jgi:hypothetical protein